MTVSINHAVRLVAQPTEHACWAASIAMLVGRTPEEIGRVAEMDLDRPYCFDEIQHAIQVWRLTTEAQGCWTTGFLGRFLEYWPLWVVDMANPRHAVVVGGMNGGGEPGDTQMTIYNPWPTGSGLVEYRTFTDLQLEFEPQDDGRALLMHS